MSEDHGERAEASALTSLSATVTKDAVSMPSMTTTEPTEMLSRISACEDQVSRGAFTKADAAGVCALEGAMAAKLAAIEARLSAAGL